MAKPKSPATTNMISDSTIRTIKSTIVLFCIFDHIFLPLDTQFLTCSQDLQWKNLLLYIFIEQFLILSTRHMSWSSIIFQTISAVSVQTYLSAFKNPEIVKAQAEKLGSSTVLIMFVVLNATINAGVAVLGSSISRTVNSRRELYLKISGLAIIMAVKILPFVLSNVEVPIVATLTTLPASSYALLTGMLCLRSCIGMPYSSMTIAIMRNGFDLRMVFQKMKEKKYGYFDIDRLIPEVQGDVFKRDEPQWTPRVRLNLNGIFVVVYVFTIAIRGAISDGRVEGLN